MVPDLSKETMAELVQRLAAGQIDALGEIVGRYCAKMRAIARE